MKENEKSAEEYEELKKIISAVDEVMENTALLDNIKSEKELEQVMPVLLASLGKYAQADRQNRLYCGYFTEHVKHNRIR